MNFPLHSNTFLLYVLLLLCTALLIGLRFEAKFAGGMGAERNPAFTSSGLPIYAGQEINSDKDSPGIISWNETKLILDDRTRIVFVHTKNDLVIRVIEGRLVITGEATLLTREVKTTIHGNVVFSHYGWLDQIDIVPIEGDVSFTTDEIIKKVEKPGRFSTLPPYEEIIPDGLPFQSALDFYREVIPDKAL